MYFINVIFLTFWISDHLAWNERTIGVSFEKEKWNETKTLVKPHYKFSKFSLLKLLCMSHYYLSFNSMLLKASVWHIWIKDMWLKICLLLCAFRVILFSLLPCISALDLSISCLEKLDIFFYYFQKNDNLQFFKGMFGNVPCLWKTWIFPSLDEKPEKNHVWMCLREMEMRTVRM